MINTKQYAIYFDFNGVLAYKFSDQDRMISENFKIEFDELRTYLNAIYYKPPLIDLWKRMNDMITEKEYNLKLAELILVHYKLPLSNSNLQIVIKAKSTSVFKLYPEVLHTLIKLQPYFKLGLLTNARPSRRTVELQNLGLNKHFDKEMVIISREVGFEKPSKEIYKMAIDRSRIDSDKIIFCDNTIDYLNNAKNSIRNLILFSDTKSDKYFTVNNFSKILNYPLVAKLLTNNGLT